MTPALEAHLRSRRAEGRKLLVPYVTGGLGEGWPDVVRAAAAAGADAIEIGIPFSDPVMDGPTIQAASQRALEFGATPSGVIAGARGVAADTGVPLLVMTYYNIVFRAGHRRFAQELAANGIGGAIVPDLPLEELDEWAEAATDAAVATVLLAAPVTPADRLEEICARSQGFVYGISLMGVTGERDQLAASARAMAERLKAVTDKPVLMGIGISTPAQAVEACEVADGVIVGSAIMRLVLDGAGATGVHDFLAAIRTELDSTDARQGAKR